MIRFFVRCILVEHVWSAGFNLRFDNLVPYGSSRQSFTSEASGFVLLIEGFEFCTIGVLETRAFVWTEERPIGILFNTFHEQVRRPERVEQITSPKFFLTVILLEIEEGENIWVPWLEVNGDRTLSLAATLVNVPCRVVKHSKHWDNSVAFPVGALDVGTL